MMLRIRILLAFCLLNSLSFAQITQTIRGRVSDNLTEVSLPGAAISVISASPVLGAATDINGDFRIANVPLGRHSIKVTMLGYEELVMPNLLLESGKELVLNIRLTEKLTHLKEVEITAGGANRSEAINELSVISARQFTVEETKRYAGAFNDPGRMALSFAGVTSNMDGNNEIVVRGNSPRGMLWRMEGVEIPNPNHFSNQGTAGGAISMLSSSMMANSDFLTGAFSADYGNAASGVFDIRLRKGNNEKREYAFQAGIIGTDLALEGPFSKNKKASYLANYRYSSLGLLQKIGFNIVGDAIPVFQDLSFNINLPTEKAGNFTVFGIGGLSHIKEEYRGVSTVYKGKYNTNLGVGGLTYTYLISPKTWIKSAVAYTTWGSRYNETANDTAENFRHQLIDEKFENRAIRTAVTLNQKISNRINLRTGFTYSSLGFNVFNEHYDDKTQLMRRNLDQSGNTGMMQSYANFMFRPAEKWTLNAGLHHLRLHLNGAESWEPRVAVKWNPAGTHVFTAGAGQHSRIEDITVYFARDNSGASPNHDLGLSKARHFVMGYETMLAPNLHFKTEVYYQHLFDVPVSADTLDSYSLINHNGGFTTTKVDNKGTGRNFGAEFTVEKYFSKSWYFLLTTSLYDSRYRGSDGVLRHTAYNGHYAGSFLAGKEFRLAERKTLSMNVRVISGGGRRYSPLMLAESMEQGRGVYDESRAFEVRTPDYLRADLGISYIVNKSKSTRTWKIDIQNVTNRQNVYQSFYNADAGREEIATQAGIIPTISYKVEF